MLDLESSLPGQDVYARANARAIKHCASEAEPAWRVVPNGASLDTPVRPPPLLVLPLALQPLGARELAQLVVRRRGLTIAPGDAPRLEQRLGISHGDLILEQRRLHQPDALGDRHLVAVRAEALDERRVVQRHRLNHQRVALPAA